MAPAAPTVERAWLGPALALCARTVLFAAFQAAIAGLLWLAGSAAPWAASSAWWLMSATLTNLVCIGLLAYCWMRLEGRRYWDLFTFDRAHWRGDLLVVLGLVVVTVPLVLLPNIGLASLLFGDAQASVTMLFKPLPAWAVWTGIGVFPVTIALAELPVYFGYVMPRLGNGWGAALLAAFFLSIQHAALPLIFDWRFMLWRAVMFLPFALLLAVALRLRPRLLVYLVIVHGLLDLSTALMYLSIR